MKDNHYIPVSCELHSELELAIMHGKTVMVHWLGDQGEQQRDLTLLDIFTKDSEEFLQARYDNQVLDIRLDKIISIA